MELTINNLVKTYPNGVKAIDNLNLTIGKGMFGLLGPNGAGKSSLMRTIATLQNPDAGSVQFKGIDVLSQPMELRKILGYLPQSFGVYPEVSAVELLDYFAILKGVASKKDRQMLSQKVLELTNLYDVRKKKVSSYSGGMRQRFGIAQLLLNNPQLIIVDEPTAGLDPAERKRFLNVLREVSAENTVIFSTHIVEDVTELCTDMAIMNQGRILATMPPKSAIACLEKQVWIATIPQPLLDAYKEKYTVLSSSFSEGNDLIVRVLSEDKPGGEFELVQADLEDVYFKYLGQ